MPKNIDDKKILSASEAYCRKNSSGNISTQRAFLDGVKWMQERAWKNKKPSKSDRERMVTFLDGHSLISEYADPNVVVRMSLVDEEGKKVADLIPSKALKSKNVNIMSVVFYDEQDRRCTRFLIDPALYRKTTKPRRR